MEISEAGEASPAVKAIEAAIADGRTVSVVYDAEEHGRETLVVKPEAIRFNNAHHKVVWCRDAETDQLMELLLDRLVEVREV